MDAINTLVYGNVWETNAATTLTVDMSTGVCSDDVPAVVGTLDWWTYRCIGASEIY